MNEEGAGRRPKVEEGQVLILEPFAGESVRVKLLEGLTAADATQLLTETCGLPVTRGPRAVLEVAVEQELLEPERQMRRLLDRVAAAEQRISQLVGEYRTVHQPFREGSLLGLILRQLYPEVDPENVQVTSVQTSAPYDAPPNPWYLLKEGDADGANALLREALDWGEAFTDQATAVLLHWR